MIDRATAVRALQDAAKDPSSFSTSELKMLMEAAEAPEPRSSNLGEGGSLIGGLHEGQPTATGGDLLEQRIAPPEAHAEKDRKTQELDRARKEYPNLGVALGVATDEESARLEADEEYKKNYDDSLPTASKRKDFARPPELIQKPPPPQPVTNPIEAFSQAASKARSYLPGFTEGGMVEHYLEPPLSQFRREMAPKIGDRVMTMNEGSREYHEYSDQLWQRIHDQAQAEGRSVVRVAYKDAKTVGEKAGKWAMQNLGGPLMGAAAGIDDVTMGAASGAAEAITGDKSMRENLNRLGETSPVSRIGGQMAGAMIPGSPGGLAARGVSKLIPEAAGYGGAALRAGLGGAAGGAATSASMNVANEESVDPDAMAISALLGFPLGAAGGAVGQGMKGARARLRAETPLADVERTGMGKTDFFKGVKRSGYADQASRAATEELGPGRENDFMARRMEEPLTAAARRLEKGTAKEIGDQQAAYYSASEADEKPIGNYLRDAMDIRRGLTTADGRPIPQKTSQVKNLDKIIGDASNVEIVPSAAGKPLVRASRPGAVDMTLEEAERAGINVTQAMRGYQASKSPPMTADLGPDVATSIPAETDVVVRVTPRSLNAEALEKMKGQLDLETGFGENPHKAELGRLTRSAREARDLYPGKGPISDDLSATVDTGTEQIGLKGFSAFQRQAAEKTGKVQRTLEHAGFDKNVPEKLGGNAAEKQYSRTAGYRQAGRSPDVDAALRELADMGKEVGFSGARQGLEETAGMRGLLELEGKSKLPLSAAVMPWKLGQADPVARQLRLDPIMGALMPGGLTGAPGSLGGVAGRKKKPLPKQFDPAMLDQLTMMMGPFLY